MPSHDAPRPSPGTFAFFALSALLAAAAPGHAAEPDTKRCLHHAPHKRVHWGDLHVHTAISMDAYIFDTRLQPADAYRYARGEEVKLAPLDASGEGTRGVRLDRPLDFAAVTDHAHSFGGVRLCTAPDSPLFESEACQNYRRPFRVSSIEEGARDIIGRINSLQSEAICGPAGKRCRDAALSAWQETQQAAADWYDTSDECRFTTFIGYEHTQTRDLTKVHRNVIFANDRVPALPISTLEEPEPLGLWQQLDLRCMQGLPGCDALAIPHNPNLSNGRMFAIEYPEGSTRADEVAIAKLRARMEPLVEMMQIKGESECRSGMWKVLGADEDCGFEKARAKDEFEDCKDAAGGGALANRGCASRLDYARYALLEGLREADRIGVNPLAFGMIAATDIHNGAAGSVRESDTSAYARGPIRPGFNNGGLAAVWAEENTRESLFSAMRRREVYGTSGPRMTLRFFGGWELPETMCGGDFAAQGYAKGVPMGGDLPDRPKGSKDRGPIFAVSALKDAGTASSPGTPLQRAQIIKGWTDPDGTFHQQVIDIAGQRDNGAAVDTKTCEPKGSGADTLCATWRDPAFDPKQRAVYYARVLENPSCRFTGWMCTDGADPRPAHCDDPSVDKVIQERAWTSPIWYAPEPTAD